ncbi:Meiotically up-regulated gene 154 protein [Erysiphe neolycopersici]|uniref:Meiotically up-regulated gene 154 protein n=1 Tax=Erysiphe neolycopersici TaxID=212602 RepID=A0A420I2X2_9PEZI|nr:Meiotically up-regulated gene 154 protein [Erysiphe neolycopersici]
MPRLIRRRPLLARIKDYLHPADWFLWLSEELETRDWDSSEYGNSVAALLHFLTLISQANISRSTESQEDVFNDNKFSFGWISSFALFVVFLVSAFSLLNALYTFYRKRSYRLFENSIDIQPRTSSAHRVRVDSSPLSSSPLRILGNLFGSISPEPMGHPNPMCHVWEIAAWDPLPICVRLFCLFSPGHILVYWLFLPTKALDPRPSVTVFKTILLQILMTVQLLLLQSRFSQQIKDSSIIHEEVMNEYDIKFVHHKLHPLVRDVGTQYISSDTEVSPERQESVTLYTPTVILKREFRTNPNPNYSRYFDPDNLSTSVQRQNVSNINPTPSTPGSYKPTIFPESLSQTSSRQPRSRWSMANIASTPTVSTTSVDGGGSLGVYSHANSPIRKAASFQEIKQEECELPKNSFTMASREFRDQNDRRFSNSRKVYDQSNASSSFGSSNYNRLGGNEDRWTSATASSTPSSALRSNLRPSQDRVIKRGPSRF